MAYVLTIKVVGSGKAILTASGGEVLSVFSGESRTISLSVGEIVNMLFQADSGAQFIKACDFLECQYVPQVQYTILQDMTNTITAEFTVSDVIINIINTGNGVIKSSSGITPLGEWSSITVKVGDQLYLQAFPNSGYVFDKWMSADGITATDNPITLTVTQPGSVTGYFKSAATAGFSIKADKTSGMSAYTANITITKSDDLSGTVYLAKASSVLQGFPEECIATLQLVNGTVTYPLQVTADMDIVAMGGLGCTCVLQGICAKSNRIKLTMGIPWGTIALVGGGLLAVYFLKKIVEKPAAPGSSIIRLGL